ncbi:zinc-dependent metalloprotease [Rugamonas sp. CCM 8940]|uniref:zinc-dependent metalloprotease n=1 Tax=Rugamonas sp. CCM 8940 TaxID=2765359 RepID=UPI0018F61772|nr:zinc-dependent metalloprotease [Rugamonas sp. CCM 8940]MBJ7308943.1 zinc-dependent metalloprotease [Rugamonas sp. CCM 8940]
MSALPLSVARSSLHLAVLLTLSACAVAQEPTPPPASPPVPAPAPTSAPTATPATPAQQAAAVAAAVAAAGAPKPFAEVSRGAAHIPGFIGLYQKDEKVWIELRPEHFDRPMFMSLNMPSGMGERGIYGSQMGESHVVYFHRIGNLVQLIAKNTEYGARGATPQALAVAQGYSDSLLANAVVASAAHPQSHAVLIEANALLFGDIAGYATALEYAFRIPFVPDPRNSSFVSIRADEAMTGLSVNAHYAVPKLPVPPLGAAALAMPGPPTTLPDPRSMFLGFYYSFMPLPAEPMHARPADDRIGHFVSTSYDFSDDVKPTLANHVVDRWRLEKRDAALALSEPKQPIVYWLDKNIPEKYRAAVRDGVLAWNAAFERIGFTNAIEVRQQGEQDRFDTMDARHASIRWYVGSDVGTAIGPHQVDPRSGEILDADIAMSDVFARRVRRMVAEDGPALPALPLNGRHEARCAYMQESEQELGFAMGLLEARGEMAMDGPQAEAVAQAYVRSIIMHEVGHTLGLRHNFRSSTIYSMQQLQDPAFTRLHGLSGSVMDYTPFNLALKGEPQGDYVASALGPYDYWAIEYAYKPIEPAQEKDELARIAGRSNEPLLAYGTDQESGGYNSDPDVNVFDLGSDPLAYYQKRLSMSRELWDRVQTRELKPGESYASLRRSFDFGFAQFSRTMPVVVKYVGGVTYLRDHAGTGRATFTPVPLPRQRAALAMLTNSLFKADSFKFAPALVSRLGADQFEGRGRPDVSIGARVLTLQKSMLDQLLSDQVAARLLDSQEKLGDGVQGLSLGELYASVQTAVWSELKGGKEISTMRRNLQREHLKRLTAILLRPSAETPADARSLQRENAIELQRDLRAALARAAGRETRAHLSESVETLGQALKAAMLRAGA